MQPHIFYPDKLKDPLVQLVYDSVWAVAIATYNSLYAVSTDKVGIGDLQFHRWTSGQEMVTNIKRMDFVGASGLVSFKNDERLTWSVAHDIIYIYIYIYYNYIYNIVCSLGTLFIILDFNIPGAAT